MKIHSLVSASKVSAEKPVKQFQCGKCKKVFPKSQGHNARTCGETPPAAPKKEPVPQLENLTPLTGVKRAPSVFEVDTLLQQKLKKGEKVSRKPQRTVDKYGTVTWELDGKLHNPDGPARVYADGGKEWWVNGKLHRLDGPAVEYLGRGKTWYRHGKRHRLDGPAVEWANGTREWWVNGKLHRLDGPAVEWANGYKEWWVDDVETEHPDLCERAVLHDLTNEEFYELCTHEDYVVRQLAAHNPHCPAEWRTLVEIMDG